MVTSLKLLREDNKASMGKQLLLSRPFVLLPSQKKKTKKKKEKKIPFGNWELILERERGGVREGKIKIQRQSDI